jgi:hypothetical protein
MRLKKMLDFPLVTRFQLASVRTHFLFQAASAFSMSPTRASGAVVGG